MPHQELNVWTLSWRLLEVKGSVDILGCFIADPLIVSFICFLFLLAACIRVSFDEPVIDCVWVATNAYKVIGFVSLPGFP